MSRFEFGSFTDNAYITLYGVSVLSSHTVPAIMISTALWAANCTDWNRDISTAQGRFEDGAE
jgi:hypothetical protein